MEKSITSLPYEQLAQALTEMGQPAFRAKQVFTWLHRDCCRDFAQMSNLPAPLREALAEAWAMDQPQVVRRLVSQEDGTIKLLLGFADGSQVETVLMRYQHGYSVCVSSQVGCRMGCTFCASTMGGVVRNLTAGEMVSQLAAASAEADGRVNHLVLMGIGEPLDNYDNVVDFISIVTHPHGHNMAGRGISLSTCGLVPQIYQLAKKNLSLTLSVSLHAANNVLRDKLMPINRKWRIEQLMEACKDYRTATGRRISFEYIMLDGVNDSDEDAGQLAALLKHTDAHVNLIPANAVDGTAVKPSGQKRIAEFMKRLEKAGVQTTVRRRLGADIDAACGQLRIRQLNGDG